MPVTKYYTVNGKIRGEATSGAYRPYGPDALGSVVATYDSTGALENTYRNAPYGASAASGGAAPTPAFLWCGSGGYRRTGRNILSAYIRARHYSPAVAQWSAKDRLWPGQRAYAYARSIPVLLTDPSGAACSEGSVSTAGFQCEGWKDGMVSETFPIPDQPNDIQWDDCHGKGMVILGHDFCALDVIEQLTMTYEIGGMVGYNIDDYGPPKCGCTDPAENEVFCKGWQMASTGKLKYTLGEALFEIDLYDLDLMSDINVQLSPDVQYVCHGTAHYRLTMRHSVALAPPGPPPPGGPITSIGTGCSGQQVLGACGQGSHIRYV